MYAYCRYIDKKGEEIEEVNRTHVIMSRGVSFDFTRYIDWGGRDFALIVCRYDHETKQTQIFPCCILIDKTWEDADQLIKNLFNRSYCEDSFSAQNLHYVNPFFWDDITDAIAKKIEYKGLLEWAPPNKVNTYGFDLRYKMQYDVPITFLRSFQNKNFLLSTISQDIEKIVNKVMMDMIVCRELKDSPLGKILNGNSTWLNLSPQKVMLKQHKWWLRRIQASREFGLEPPDIDQGEIAIFNQVKNGLRDSHAFKGSKIDNSRLTVSNVTLKHGYSVASRMYMFMCTFGGVQVSSVSDFIRLLKLTGMYDEVSDVCSKYILTKA